MNCIYYKKSKHLLILIMLIGFSKGFSQENNASILEPESSKDYLIRIQKEAEEDIKNKELANDVYASQDKTEFQSQRENPRDNKYLSGLESENGYVDLDKLQSSHESAERTGNLKILGFFVLIGILIFWLAYKVSSEKGTAKTNELPNVKETKISTIGYYSASKSDFSENINENFEVHFMLKFNPHGLVAFAESNDGPINPNYEELKSFNKEISYHEFSDIGKYEKKGENIAIKFYQPEDSKAYERRFINENIYNEWIGKIVNDKTLLLSYRKSYFNNALQDYKVDYYFKNLLFHLKH
ncbi:hypothetical protein NO995_06325 [Aestuariibaculum sp. M13]|uniref:hypothetical protein n=1 Tax=Aestuariibaculum sp. M13 TaxID=2967132 RepID=UPI002159E755|nr:hypothetical protein [Aestuariibaculum sp. M13]MCR8667288.1 hypothetical protein [Aestuariibaculum sp. M13]